MMLSSLLIIEKNYEWTDNWWKLRKIRVYKEDIIIDQGDSLVGIYQWEYVIYWWIFNGGRNEWTGFGFFFFFLV